MNRRAFIKLCGCAGCGVFLTLAGCTPPAAKESVQPTTTALPPTPQPTATADAGLAATAASPTATAPALDAVATPTALPRTGKILCPKKIYWDPYPGKCKKYRDTNGNGYCDWSEPA